MSGFCRPPCSSSVLSPSTRAFQCHPFIQGRCPHRRSIARAGAGDSAAWEQRQELLADLQLAVDKEDYASAARIKSQLDAFEDADPLVAVKKRLQQAVAEERYQDASQLKRELMELEQRLQPPGPAPQPELEQVPCCSDTTTAGVRVQVESQYVPQQSLPVMGRYFFKYKVTISNNSSSIVQLKSRHWVISDANGRVEHVRGPGVVGEKPVLSPGNSYVYESACPLHTSYGTMHGEYLMSVFDEGAGSWAPEPLKVQIGKFKLSTISIT